MTGIGWQNDNLEFMKKQTLGLIRHGLTFGGGYLVAQDWISSDVMIEVVGAIMTIVGAVWSVTAPEKK